MSRTRARRRNRWTPFKRAAFAPEQMTMLRRMGAEPHQIWLNNRYQVLVRFFDNDNGQPMAHLSIKRLDKAPIHDWRDLQRIKNEILGTDVEAVELYPSEDRVVDTSNQYHLWAFPPGAQLPWGFRERLLVEDGSTMGSKQRPFDGPTDAITAEQADSLTRQMMKGDRDDGTE